MLSVITPLPFNKVSASNFQVTQLGSFFRVESKRDPSIKILIENQLPVKSNQIHRFLAVLPIKCLTPNLGG